MITYSFLQEVLHFAPTTGVFTWRSAPGRSTKKSLIGTQAGAKHHSGYVFIKIRGKKYAAHRLAWLYVLGQEPPKYIDHINRDKSDNRICNLRAATRAQNAANMRGSSATGFKGVSHSRNGRFYARIRHNYQCLYLGTFATAEEASQAYQAKAKELFGDFSGCFTH